jgi:hypothetical protein
MQYAERRRDGSTARGVRQEGGTALSLRLPGAEAGVVAGGARCTVMSLWG